MLFWEQLHSLLSTLNSTFVCCTGVRLWEMSKNFFFFRFSTKIQNALVPGCFAEMPIKASSRLKSAPLNFSNKTRATVTLDRLNPVFPPVIVWGWRAASPMRTPTRTKKNLFLFFFKWKKNNGRYPFIGKSIAFWEPVLQPCSKTWVNLCAVAWETLGSVAALRNRAERKSDGKESGFKYTLQTTVCHFIHAAASQHKQKPHPLFLQLLAK